MTTKPKSPTPNPTTHHQPSQSHTLGTLALLPTEIRLLIYTFATSRIGLGNELQWPDPRSTHGAGIRDRRHALALLRLNKQIYSEAVAIVYGGKFFRITIEVPNASPYLLSTNGWKHYIAADEDAALENMPGPAGPSSTSWWHLLSGIEVTIHGVWHLRMKKRFWECRLWEVLAQRRKVARLVDSLRNAQDQGLGLCKFEIYVTGRFSEGETLGGDWLGTVGDRRPLELPHAQRHEVVYPMRNLPDRPWTDLEFVMVDFKRLRNVEETDVELPSRDRGLDDPASENGCFCFDDPEPLAETMKRPVGSDHLAHHDKAMICKMEEFHSTAVRYWETHDYKAPLAAFPLPEGGI